MLLCLIAWLGFCALAMAQPIHYMPVVLMPAEVPAVHAFINYLVSQRCPLAQQTPPCFDGTSPVQDGWEELSVEPTDSRFPDDVVAPSTPMQKHQGQLTNYTNYFHIGDDDEDDDNEAAMTFFPEIPDFPIARIVDDLVSDALALATGAPAAGAPTGDTHCDEFSSAEGSFVLSDTSVLAARDAGPWTPCVATAVNDSKCEVQLRDLSDVLSEAPLRKTSSSPTFDIDDCSTFTFGLPLDWPAAFDAASPIDALCLDAHCTSSTTPIVAALLGDAPLCNNLVASVALLDAAPNGAGDHAVRPCVALSPATPKLKKKTRRSRKLRHVLPITIDTPITKLDVAQCCMHARVSVGDGTEPSPTMPFVDAPRCEGAHNGVLVTTTMSDSEYLFSKMLAATRAAATDEMKPYPLRAKSFHVPSCQFFAYGSCRSGRRCKYSHLSSLEPHDIMNEIQRHLSNGVKVNRIIESENVPPISTSE